MQYPQALAAGTIVAGEFRIVRALGDDGFCLAYEAEDTQFSNRILVKEYFPAGLALRGAGGAVRSESIRQIGQFAWGRKRFLDEALTLARIDHPAITRVRRTLEANNTAYAILDYEDGPTLVEWVNGLRRRPTQKELDAVASPLLDALEKVHEAGILHRNITPEHIRMRNGRDALLTDFGAARAQFGVRTRKVHATVHPGYSAPEQYLFSDDSVGPSTDVFGLCASLYRVLLGRGPDEVVARGMDSSMPKAMSAPREAYRPEFLQSIDLGMSLDAGDRPQSMRALRLMLLDPFAAEAEAEEAPKTERPVAPAGGGSHRARIQPQRPGGMRWVWGLAAVLAGVILSGLFLLERPEFLGGARQGGRGLEGADARAEQRLAEKRAADEASRREAARKDAERKEAERLAAQKREADRREAERKAAEKRDADRRAAEEAARKEAERTEAERRIAEKREADRREAERIAAEKRAAEEARKEAERRAAEKREADRREAERLAAEKRAAEEAARREADRKEAERLAAEKRTAEEAARREADRKEAERRLAEKREADRREAERLAAEKRAAEEARKDAERVAAEKREADRREAERVAAEKRAAEETARRETERQEAERKDTERKEAERRLAERREAERREAERLAVEKRAAEEAARLEAARKEAERQLAEKSAAARREAERREAERLAALRAAEEAARQSASRIARETDRDALMRIASLAPTEKAAVEQRLASLGFIAISSQGTVEWRKPGAGEPFRDCQGCPAMVLLPAGRVLLGSRAGDAGRQEDEDDTAGAGGKQVEVAFATPLAVGQLEVTRAEFAQFVSETGHKADEGCHARYGGWQLYADLSWKDPGFAQDDKHPVVCVSWRDAKAFTRWLSRKTGHVYRLLTEAEWEYAARGSASGLAAGRFHFGSDEKALCQHGNAADMTALQANPEWLVSQCVDGHVNTAPAGAYRPNAFGLFDTMGNAWEWVEDCYADSHRGVAEALRSGATPVANAQCGEEAPRVLKGGSWSDAPKLLRPSARVASSPDIRDEIAGFRVARVVEREAR